MKLYEEAARISILNIDMYSYGLHIAVGIAATWIAVGIWCRQKQMKNGTATLLMILSILMGGFCSRLFFCLMDQSLGMAVPVSAWFNIAGGGWSLTGLILGMFAASWACGKITGQPPITLLDISACAIPLLIAAERLGDRLIEDFNTGRPLEEGWLSSSFLAVQGEYETYLRTYYLAAAAAIILFLILNILAARDHHKDGSLFIMFLLMSGAAGIVLESLRYDYFLSITFVHLQQIVFALYLLAGAIVAAVRVKNGHQVLRWVAPLSVVGVAGAVIGIEFAIDRSDINNLLLYIAMIIVVLIPVVLGMLLLERKENAH